MARSQDVAGRTRRTTLFQGTVTADAFGASVDVTDLSGRGLIAVTIGVPNNADNTIEAQLQDSADDSTFADVTGATTGARTSDVAEIVEITPVDFNEIEQFARISFEGVAGTGVSYEVACIAISGGHVLPTG